MKKTTIVVLLLCSMFLSLVLLSGKSAYAFGDPMSLTTISGLAYAIGQSSGLVFNFTDGTAAGAQNNMESAINSWLAGRSVADVFGITPAQIIAGKLIVPMTLFNGIKNFLEDFIDDMGIGTSSKEVWKGSIGGVPIGEEMTENELLASGISCVYQDKPDKDDGIVQARFYLNGVLDAYYNSRQGYSSYGTGWCVRSVSSGSTPGKFRINYRLFISNGNNGDVTGSEHDLGITDQVSMSVPDGFDQTVLNPDEEWSGTIGGQDWPDTNLDQLIGSIFDDVSQDILDIDGEVIDVPIPPEPTPAPIDPDTPLSDVPWEGLNDLIGSSTGTIGEGIQDQTDAITGAQEATTEAVESLTETIEGALDTPTTEELPDFKFDLRELFPFCIPFDIYRLLSSFDAEPVAPHIQLPIVIDSINFRYNLDLDFSAWNPVAQAMRTAELIVYAIALAWATGKVIKW